MKKKQRKPIRFRGWDWTELAQLEQIASEWPSVPKTLKPEGLQTQEDVENAYQIRGYLSSLVYDTDRARERKLASGYVRKFCLALSKCEADYSRDIYLAFAKLENDDILLQWVCNNLEVMWN